MSPSPSQRCVVSVASTGARKGAVTGGVTGAVTNSGLRFDVMNKLNAHGGLFVGQKAAAAAGAHM